MQQEEQAGAPGFGKNTGGWGIVIVAAVAVVLALVCWNFWKTGTKDAEHFRYELSDGAHGAAHGEAKHGEGAHGEGAGHADAATHSDESGMAMVEPAALGKLDTAGNFIYSVGDTVELKLPNGTLLKVGSNSTEAKLVAFLLKETVDTSNKTKGWITCDRIYFESGKANITAGSASQIANLGLILNAFPNATLKIGGYTDNTGSEELNVKVSTDRAKMIADAIKAKGVKNGLAAEGYGPEHPIASNDTNEGKALNRRVDLRVTKK